MFFFFKQKTAYEIMPSLVGSEMCIRDRYSLLSISPQSAFLECDNLFPDRMETDISAKSLHY